MSSERELAALNRRLNDLSDGKRLFTCVYSLETTTGPYPADARDGDLVVTIKPPLDWHEEPV